MIRTILISVGLLAAASAPIAAAEPKLDCSTGAALHRLHASLPATASAIRRGEDIVVVAIGSSSTSGAGASDPAHSYPAQLTRELQKRWPALAVTVLNRGIGGETAPDMIARFERDVTAYNPDLVVWQLGTNSLFRSVSVDTWTATLLKGIRLLKRARADIILMDPQYAPRVLQSTAHVRVVETMRAAARDTGVGLFPRFAVMQAWIDSGRFKMEDLVSPDSLHMNDTSYACVARLLAAGIADAVRQAPMPMAVNTKTDAALR